MSGTRPRKNIFILGLVSLFTDLSSQMVYPLIPEFLVSIGANKAMIGIIEGVAESAASLFRTLFGRLSDKLRKRKLFIFFGYGLSALSKPFLYLANIWTVVLGIRFSDRMGKAIRTPARDALISTSVDPSEKGRAFGLHRAMDRIGAIGGPILAMLVLSFFNNNVRLVFLLSVIPGILALFFVKFAKETTIGQEHDMTGQKHSLRNASFIIFLISNIVFTLGNSTNAFLILRAREAGLEILMIPVIWVVYNIFCTISSPIFGSLSDRFGKKPIIIISFLYYSVIYLLFGMAKSILLIWILFAAYGIYYGLSAGVFRAYIADLVEAKDRATAYGLFNTGIGLALLPASLIMGALWDRFGSKWAFIVSSGFSLLGFMIFMVSLFLRFGKRKIKHQF
jgi:MFS family permease